MELLVRRVDCKVWHDWKILSVAFLFKILHLSVQALPTFDNLITISIRDIDIAIFAQGVEQEVAFSHAKPELVARAFRAERQQHEWEERHHQRNRDDEVRKAAVVMIKLFS